MVTEAEAGRVLAVVLAGTVQRERSQEDLHFLRRYLIPLPYERTLRRVEEYVAVVGRDKDGRATHGWISTPGELLEACGLPDKPAVRGQLVLAMREGGELLPDLRSMDGWSYVPPGAVKPVGVLQAEAVACAAAAPNLAALPPPMPRRPELVEAVEHKVSVLAQLKRVAPPKPSDRPQPSAAQIEAELVAADVAFQEELRRAEATTHRRFEDEDGIPY